MPTFFTRSNYRRRRRFSVPSKVSGTTYNVSLSEGAIASDGALWTPARLSSLLGWWKADSLGLSDGTAVASWTDSSDYTHDAVQSNAGLRPVCKTNILNGLPVVRFTAASGHGLELTNLGTDLSGDDTHSWFIVSKPSDLSGYPVFITYPVGSTWSYLIEYNNDGDIFWGAGSGNGWYRCFDANFDTATFSLISLVKTASNAFGMWKYGTQIANGFNGPNGAVASTTSMSGNMLMGGYFSTSFGMQGDIAEIVCCSSALSTSERQNVEGYLAWKWGLQSQLPTDHPYYGLAPYLWSTVLRASGPCSDGIKGGDSEATTLRAVGSLTDGVLSGDTLIGYGRFPRSIGDGAVGSDTCVGYGIFPKSSTETAILSDAISGVLRIPAALTDGVKAGDSESSVLYAVGNWSEGSKVSDTSIGNLLIGLSVSDGAVGSDSEAIVMALSASISEGAVASDAETLNQRLAAAWNEGSVAGDLWQRTPSICEYWVHAIQVKSANSVRIDSGTGTITVNANMTRIDLDGDETIEPDQGNERIEVEG
jgi:hypothetical protein